MSCSPEHQRFRYRLEFNQLSPDAPLGEDLTRLLKRGSGSAQCLIICTSNAEEARRIYDELSKHCVTSWLRLDCHCATNGSDLAACACLGNCSGQLQESE